MKVQNSCQTKASFENICFFLNVGQKLGLIDDNDDDAQEKDSSDSSVLLTSEFVFLLICCWLHVTMHVSMHVPLVANYDGFFVLAFYHLA